MYIALEGIDGSGKSTIIEQLKSYYPEAYFTKEPGGTEFGQKILDLLKNKTYNSTLTEFFLFQADRIENLNKLKNFYQNRIIISDRCFLSSLVYQGLDIGEGFIKKVIYQTTPLLPDFIILLDCPANIALKRIQKRFSENDLITKLENLEKYRERYLLLTSNLDFFTKVFIVDSNRDFKIVLNEIIDIIECQHENRRAQTFS